MTTRRHSKKRAQVLQVLQDHHGTLSAADIHARLPELDLATIYRNLDIFVADGEVKKLFLSPHGKEAVYEYQHEPHHHAVCQQCDKVLHFTIEDDKLYKLLPLQDFDISEVELTVRGRCQK